MKHLILIALFSLSLLPLTTQGATDNHDQSHDDHASQHAAHEAAERAAITARLATLKNADIYACQLIAYGNQCREYPIPKAESQLLATLQSSCASLPAASLSQSPCPQENRVGTCHNIVQNNHDPKTLIYTSIYYGGEQSPWTAQEIARVCADMEGEFTLSQTPEPKSH